MESVIETNSKTENSAFQQFIDYLENLEIDERWASNYRADWRKIINGLTELETTLIELYRKKNLDEAGKLKITTYVKYNPEYEIYNSAVYILFELFKINNIPRLRLEFAIDRFLQIAINIVDLNHKGSTSIDYIILNIRYNFPFLFNLMIYNSFDNSEYSFYRGKSIFKDDITTYRELNSNKYSIKKAKNSDTEINKILLLFSNEMGYGKDNIKNKDTYIVYVFFNFFERHAYLWNDESMTFLFNDYMFEVDFKISHKDNNAQILMAPIFHLVNGFSTIEDVYVEFSEVRISSYLGKLWVKIKTLSSLKKVIDYTNTIIEIGGKAASAGTVSHSTVKKTVAEEQKIIAEKNKIEKDIELLPDPEVKKKKDYLELAEKEALIKKILTDNDKTIQETEKIKEEALKLKLENISKLIDINKQVAELVKQGIIQADKAEIYLNRHLLILKNDDKINTGDLMDPKWFT